MLRHEYFLRGRCGRSGARVHPVAEIVRNREMLYLAIGILGATVMPHNLYLHSSLVQRERFRKIARQARSHRFATLDSTLASVFRFSLTQHPGAGRRAFSSARHDHGRRHQQAYQTPDARVGASLASTLFACGCCVPARTPLYRTLPDKS